MLPVGSRDHQPVSLRTAWPVQRAMHTVHRPCLYAMAAGAPGGGFGAAASAHTSATKENGALSFKPANTSPAGDYAFCLLSAQHDVKYVAYCSCVNGAANSETTIGISDLSNKHFKQSVSLVDAFAAHQTCQYLY